MSLRSCLAVAALVAGPVLAGCGQPSAGASAPAPTTDAEQASACRPANHRGVITPDDASAGHRHYRVTLTAAPGYEPCAVAGAPTRVVFRDAGGAPLGVGATASAGQGSPVEFGPGHDIHFDVSVPDGPGGARAASVTFVLSTPDGEVPGEQEASGDLQVDAGTQVSAVRSG